MFQSHRVARAVTVLLGRSEEDTQFMIPIPLLEMQYYTPDNQLGLRLKNSARSMMLIDLDSWNSA